MKKILVIAMCAALVATFTACNSSSDSSSESASEEKEEAVEEEPEEAEETVKPEETDAEEALDEEMDEPEEGTTTTEDGEQEYITTTFEGMTFSYPADCQYEEGDDYVLITFEEGKEFMEIIPYGEYEPGEDATLSIGDWLEYYLRMFLTNFDEVQDESFQDMTLAGCEAKGVTCFVSRNSTWYSYSGVAVYSDQHNFYQIIYSYAYGAEGRVSDYEAFLDSISFE